MPWITEHQLQSLVDRHGAALLLYARQWCNSPEDVLQEAFIALAHLSSEPDDIPSWLFGVVRNKSLTLRRADERRTRHTRGVCSIRTLWFEENPGALLDAREIAGWIEDLPEFEREILVARIWGDLTFEQISKLVELPVSTVHRHFRSSLSKLRQQYLMEHRNEHE